MPFPPPPTHRPVDVLTGGLLLWRGRYAALTVPLTPAELGQGGAAGLEPGFPHQLPWGHLGEDGHHGARVALHRHPDLLQHGVEGGLRVCRQGRGL